MVGMGEFRYCKEDAMAWTIHEDIDFRRTLQIKMVSHGKVWILKGAGYDEVIAIKIDSASVTATQIEHSSIAVEVIDGVAVMRELSNLEKCSLQSYCEDHSVCSEFFRSLLGVSHGVASNYIEERDAVQALRTGLGSGGVVVKMAEQQMENDLRLFMPGRVEDLGGRKTRVHAQCETWANWEGTLEHHVWKFAASLKEPGGLECLGRVVAGDLFNGNRDRFDPYAGEKEMHASPHTITFQCTVNPGNIIFVRGGDGKYRPSMADYADPSSLSKDLDEESDFGNGKPGGGATGEVLSWQTRRPEGSFVDRSSMIWK